jgi:uncharacterized protein (DUF58 family)
MVAGFLTKGPRVELEQLIRLRHLAGDIVLFPINHSHSQGSGNYRSRFRGRGMDFEEVRLYQPGDDIRSIDWRVTARTAKTHTKIFKEEKDRPIIIAVDQGPTLFFGSQVTYKSVMAAQLAALLAWAGLQQNDKVGGIVFNQHSHHEIKPLRNKNAVLKLLEKISEFNHQYFLADLNTDSEKKIPEKTDSEINFSEMLEKLHHIALPGSAVYLISDFMDFDEKAERLLHLIKRHTDVYALVIADPLEKNLPTHGNFTVTDGAHKLRFNSNDQQLSAHYKNAFEARIAKLQASFEKLQIANIVVWTNDDPHKQILHLTRQ